MCHFSRADPDASRRRCRIRRKAQDKRTSSRLWSDDSRCVQIVSYANSHALHICISGMFTITLRPADEDDDGLSAIPIACNSASRMARGGMARAHLV